MKNTFRISRRLFTPSKLSDSLSEAFRYSHETFTLLTLSTLFLYLSHESFAGRELFLITAEGEQRERTREEREFSEFSELRKEKFWWKLVLIVFILYFEVI